MQYFEDQQVICKSHSGDWWPNYSKSDSLLQSLQNKMVPKERLNCQIYCQTQSRNLA